MSLIASLPTACIVLNSMYIVLCCKLLPHLIIYAFTQEHVITTSLTSSKVHSLTLYVEVTDTKSGTPGIKTSAVESECGRIESSVLEV